MIWIGSILWSSIGKKWLMAATGLSFCAFLAVHLAGNLTLFGGNEPFNTYAEKLHEFGALITIAEWGLVLLALVHVSTGTVLFVENLRSRPVRYEVNKSAGGRTIGSMTMPYTGFLLLLFIIYHLIGFHFADKTDQTVYDIVAGAFGRLDIAAWYILAMIVVSLHISHGFWSAFQTIGASHPKYAPVVNALGILFCLAAGIGFGSIPVYMYIAHG